MGNSSSGKNSKKLDKRWKASLEAGVCHVGDCDLTTATCQHLDSYLGMKERVSVQTTHVPRIEAYPNPPKPDEQLSIDFRDKLLHYELTETQREALILKFVFNMTYREIAKEMKIKSTDTVHDLLKRTLKTLKEQGFSL